MKKQYVKSQPFVQERGCFSGYASVFWEVDGDQDVVVAGAFSQSLIRQRPVALLWQHDTQQPIGRVLELREDAYGLYMRAELNIQTQRGAEAYSLLQQGGLSGLSVGFKVLGYDRDSTSGVRFITEAELWEISLVTFPANDKARVHDVKQHALCEYRQF